MKFLQALLFVTITMSVHQSLRAQNCVLSCPSNIIVKTESGKEGATVNFPSMTTATECGTITYTPASGSFFRLGSHSIIVTSSSGQKCSFTVTVSDNESPVLSPISLSRQTIWPASNKMKKVNVGYTATDNGQNLKTELSVSSNATDGVRDWEIIDNHTIRLKSSRLADGSPRVYMITVTATDESGNKTSRTTSIAVSKTMMAKPQ